MAKVYWNLWLCLSGRGTLCNRQNCHTNLLLGLPDYLVRFYSFAVQVPWSWPMPCYLIYDFWFMIYDLCSVLFNPGLCLWLEYLGYCIETLPFWDRALPNLNLCFCRCHLPTRLKYFIVDWTIAFQKRGFCQARTNNFSECLDLKW